MTERVRFSENAEVVSMEEINDMQFAKLRIKAYSTALTAHGYFSTRKQLKKAAKSICNKPLLVYVNPFTDDFEAHEDDGLFRKEIPCGFVPNEELANIEISKDEDGTYFLICDAYIWTMYFQNVKEIFERDNGIKSVSVELLAIETEDKDDNTIELKEFSFTGITLLGEKIKPAVTGANAVLVKNSTSTTDEYEKAKVEFEKILYNSVKQESVETGSFFNTNNKEESMETEVVKNSTTPDVIENATQETDTYVSVSTDTYTYDDDGKFVSSTHEHHSVSTTTVEEVPEEEIKTEVVVENATDNVKTEEVENTESVENAKTIENSADESVEVQNSEQEVVENAYKVENSAPITMEEFEALKTKCSALKSELESKQADYEALMQKFSVLEDYKKNKENENMKNAIEVALNSVSHILNAAQIAEWRTESEKCSVETLDVFTNKLKAFAFDVQEQNGIIQTETIRNSIPREVENEPTDFWERIEKTYN